MTIGEIVLSLLMVVTLMWIQLLNSKINRIQNTLFKMKYKIAIPHSEEEK
jgi:hypothetical protein